MLIKQHVFTIIVKTDGSRQSAEAALLCSFSCRQPDGCKFYLNKTHNEKDAYVAGSMSGVQLGFELAIRSIEQQMKHLKIKRGLKTDHAK